VALLARLVKPEQAVVDQQFVIHDIEVIGNWRKPMYACITRKA
jgi:hypothetical protein